MHLEDSEITVCANGTIRRSHQGKVVEVVDVHRSLLPVARLNPTVGAGRQITPREIAGWVLGLGLAVAIGLLVSEVGL